MPEEKKSKSDPKEQRKSRRRHDQRAEKKNEKQSTPAAVHQTQEVPKAPEKPAYEPPGPEFYKGLKRETDEIIKITEEENMKYKKKEIQSNWAKYEMPIESYNEIEEQENMGADYEALIQAPLSVGGHFQFKHEKSWDMDTGPSIYDKYFDIEMDNLCLALCTVPFYERNNIDKSNFSEADIFNMDNRVTKFKQKYYNDKKYTTPELEAQETILNKLTHKDDKDDNDAPVRLEHQKEESSLNKQIVDNTKDIDFLEKKLETLPVKHETPVKNHKIMMTLTQEVLEDSEKMKPVNIVTDLSGLKETQVKKSNQKNIENKYFDDIDDITDIIETKPKDTEVKLEKEALVKDTVKMTTPVETNLIHVPQTSKVANPVPEEQKKNPIIESPEDLEKWLDDFLDE